ncbi:hypothetical protein OCOL_001281 [Ordospora colligata]|uniref:TOG domain-containing protein n=1 Tax=Ordospora colligata OC4 TaxID=1354746 RepID=A0A0B2UIZ4_9MICR|nr:uncharacterized protein M896_121780 [Ordospora colligata OC4]KHN68955.1 hypothetical protein M896_121780 [Ordospora colligata OC4]
MNEMESQDSGILVRMKSKSWKDRLDVYEELRGMWRDGVAVDREVIRMMQSESNIPALEMVIDALLNVRDLCVDDIKKIFVNIGNAKTSVKTRIDALIDNIEDTEGLVEVFCELMSGKSPKSIAAAVQATGELVRKRGCDLGRIGKRLAEVMGNTDKVVRSEGAKLCVELYKRNGESVLPYLDGLKPIQKKELMEEFAKCEVLCTEEACSEPENAPLEVLRDCEDENWKVRLEAMRSLKKISKNMECTGEISRLLSRRLGDVNNQVFLMALDVIKDVKPRSTDIIRGLVERLKEKKGSGSEKIKEVLECLGFRLDAGNAEYLSHKNPCVRYNLLDYSLKNECKDKVFLKKVGDCMMDPVGDVRGKAIEVVSSVYEKYGDIFDLISDQGVLQKIRKVISDVNKLQRNTKEVSADYKNEKQTIVERSGAIEAISMNEKIKKESSDIKIQTIQEKPKENAVQDDLKEMKEMKVIDKGKEKTVGDILSNGKRKHTQGNSEFFAKNFNKQRVKGSGTREDVFTQQFIEKMDNDSFHKVVEMFDVIDKVAVSDFFIDYMVRSKAPEAPINSMLLSFISSKYILKECECKQLVEYLLAEGMFEELKMMDRVYPVTKLFLVYQKIGSKQSNDEILKLVKKYKMFRGNKKMFIDGVRRDGGVSIDEVIKGCPDFLSFVDELEGSFMSTKDTAVDADVNMHAISEGEEEIVGQPEYRDRECNDDVDEEMNAPFVQNESFVIDEADIEASFDALSIHSTSVIGTPNSKKIRRSIEFVNEPRKEDEGGLGVVLDYLIDSNPDVSKVAFKRLINIIDIDLEQLLAFSNSIVSSISIQLFDVLHDSLFCSLILQVFFKLSQSQVFCRHLRKETLLGANSDLIKIMKKYGGEERNEGTRMRLPSISSQDSSLVGEILINLCLNSKPSQILEVYLDMLECSKEEILLKLIWRHSKTLNMDDRDEIRRILCVLMKFYDSNYGSAVSEDGVALKILQLHLKEIVKFYKEGVHEFGLRGLAKVFADRLLRNNDIVRRSEIE